MSDPELRRRRLRPARADRSRSEPASPSAFTADVHDPHPIHAAPTHAHPTPVDPANPDRPHGLRRAGAAVDERETERGLHGLVGAGASQLSISAALRARDAARPTAADLTEAEEQVVLVRRNWVPRDNPR